MKLNKNLLAASIVSVLSVSSAHAVLVSGGFTGNWRNAATDGQGFQMQVLPDGRAGAFWFTFDGSGNQVWISGVGTVENNQLTMQMRRPVGAQFGPNFNSDDIQRIPFGTVSMSFDDCNNGTVTWQSDDPQFGSGSMPIERVTSSAGVNCTGSVSDNTTSDDPIIDFRQFLDNVGAFPAATARIDYESRPAPTRTEFDVELEDLPVGDYQLLVDGTERAIISVVATDDGTEGDVEFSSPQDDGELLLDFEPLGALIEIADAGGVLFSGVADPANSGGGDDGGGDDGGAGGGDDNAPPFGNTETEVDFINTGLDADASGDVELEQRPDRVEFDVEIEDLDLGSYELWVGGMMITEIEVVTVEGGTEGEVEFRNPVEPGKLLLDFNPIGQFISIEQAGSVFLEVEFPTELGNGDDDDDDDDGDDGDDDDGDDDNGGSDDDDNDRIEIEADFANTGVDADASGDAEYEERSDRIEFDVEVEDLDVGAYNLIVGGTMQATFDVIEVDGGTRGEVDFRTPSDDPEDLPLEFDPRGQLIEIEQAGVVFLSVDFPLESTGDDDDNGGNDDDDDNDDDNGGNDDDDDERRRRR